MADDADPYDLESDPDQPTIADLRPKDWLLDEVLNFFYGGDDARSATFTATFSVGGVVVSGTVISFEGWIERTGEVLANAAPEIAEFLEVHWRGIAVETSDFIRKRQEAGLPAFARRYLHMRDVLVSYGGPQGTNHDLWRLNLADVSSWTFGGYSPTADRSRSADE